MPSCSGISRVTDFDEEDGDANAGCCTDVMKEVTERGKHCATDYRTALQHISKTLSAALFMFFATLFSTVALGALIEKKTNNRIGLTEYLTANSVAGILHSLVASQPLLVLRPTGPITAITCKLSDIADKLGFDFHVYLAATGICIGIFMGVIAALGLSRHISRLTPFTHDIFACFVCSIYVNDGIQDVLGRFDQSSAGSFGDSLFALNLALITFGVSLVLSGATGWSTMPRRFRTFLADYAVTIAVVMTTIVSYASRIASANVHRISLPDELGPTCFRAQEHYLQPGTPPCFHAHHKVSALDAAASGAEFHRRGWGVPVFEGSAWLWLVACASAVPITFFFYMDQNISSLLCQLPEMGLGRGYYLHSSFAAMAVFNAVGPLFGCPFVTGSLPHSPQFVRSLTIHKPSHFVVESRVAPLVMYMLIGSPLLFPNFLEHIPESAIDGILAYVGYEGIVQTGLWKRIVLMLTPYDEFPQEFVSVRPIRIHLYTALQLSLFGLCWLINLSPFGLCVAFLIVSLVPMREMALPILFTPEELDVLDSSTRAHGEDSALVDSPDGELQERPRGKR